MIIWASQQTLLRDSCFPPWWTCEPNKDFSFWLEYFLTETVMRWIPGDFHHSVQLMTGHLWIYPPNTDNFCKVILTTQRQDTGLEGCLRHCQFSFCVYLLCAVSQCPFKRLMGPWCTVTITWQWWMDLDQRQKQVSGLIELQMRDWQCGWDSPKLITSLSVCHKLCSYLRKPSYKRILWFQAGLMD